MPARRRWTDAGTPLLSTEETRQLRAFFEVYEQRYDEVQSLTLAEVSQHPVFGPIVRAMSAAEMEENQRRSRALMRGALVDGDWERYVADLRRQGTLYAKMGVAFGDWFDLVGPFQSMLLPALLEGRTPEEGVAAARGMDLYLNLAMATIGEEYLRTKELIIGQQQNALRELSTPVLQIRERLLLLPIIGVIDSQRALQLTQQLLVAVRAHRARVAVMDITGVGAVDSKVANHLLQTVAAARLMGARVVITGLSAEVAHSLVLLGVDTSQLITTGDLQSGIEEAERILGYVVRRREEGPAGAGQC